MKKLLVLGITLILFLALETETTSLRMTVVFLQVVRLTNGQW